MPQLQLFKRRWRIAADTLPLLSGFMFVLHIACIVPLFLVTLMTETESYECNQKTMVRVALFGTLTFHALGAANEAATTVAGLRGGPLEDHRRRIIRPLLYAGIVLFVFALGMTIYATVILADPAVDASCWSNNPCAVIYDEIPSACTKDQSGGVALTPACATLVAKGDEFANSCWPAWFDYGSIWMKNNYNDTRRPPFNPPPGDASCGDRALLDEKDFEEWLLLRNINFEFRVDEMYALQTPRLSADIEARVLRGLGIVPPGSDAASGPAGTQAPWFRCLTTSCQEIVQAGDDCSDWDVLAGIPNSKSRKSAFMAAICSSWVILAVQVLVTYFAFNAWPEYEDEEAWVGTVQYMSRFLGCAKVLAAAKTDQGEEASQHIGRLMHLLFGAVDLDSSDQALGLYLVAERQQWRRQRHVIAALQKAGLEISTAKRASCCVRFNASIKTAFNRFRDWFHRREDVSLVTELDEGVVLSDGTTDIAKEGTDANGNGGGGGEVEIEAEAAGQGVSQTLPPSPFDCIHDDKQGRGSVQSAALLESSSRRPLGLEYTPPAIATTFVRLVSVPMSIQEQDQELEQLKEEDGGSPVSPGQKSSWFGGLRKGPKRSSKDDPPHRGNSPRTSTSSAKSSSSNVQPLRKKLRGKTLIRDDRQQPLLTPILSPTLSKKFPISPYRAARIYGGAEHPIVPASDLEDLLAMSRIAKAAYGLQDVMWPGGAGAGCCCSATDTVDGYMNCLMKTPLKHPCGVNAHFKRRNFESILRVAGVAPADLLYVSYTSAAFGILPYMVLLHRPTRSVVVAIRGTVGFEDLLTDLLSNPLDCSEEMPEWVHQEIGDDAEGLFAHAGILSSTRAILKDLEKKGMLKAMRAGYINRKSGSAGHGAASAQATSDPPQHVPAHTVNECEPDGTLEMDVARAQTAVRDAITHDGWGVIVTGHSLGAAVGGMLSFHLREHFPDVKCIAFCPPGGLVSAPLSRVAQRFCTSVVVGCDMIPRVGLRAVRLLVDDMILALARCKRPKLAVLCDVLTGRRGDPETAPPTFCAFEDIGSEAREALEKYVATSELHSADMRELYPPGKIVFLRPFVSQARKKKGGIDVVWDAVFVAAQDLTGEGLLITPAMIQHHRVDTMMGALKSASTGEAAGPEDCNDNLAASLV